MPSGGMGLGWGPVNHCGGGAPCHMADWGLVTGGCLEAGGQKQRYHGQAEQSKNGRIDDPLIFGFPVFPVGFSHPGNVLIFHSSILLKKWF